MVYFCERARRQAGFMSNNTSENNKQIAPRRTVLPVAGLFDRSLVLLLLHEAKGCNGLEYIEIERRPMHFVKRAFLTIF
jgi:hypothetical protein